MITTLTTKRIDPKLTREQWEEVAIKIFQGVYEGQMSRILKAINRAAPDTIEAILSKQFYVEPTLIKAMVQRFYDDLAFSSGEAALYDYNIVADWDVVGDALFRLSRARAGWFARGMTETSQRQTQLVVRDWLSGGEATTVRDLREAVSKVWTGPRPDAAATTETTYVYSESQFTAWQAAGDIWGYGINTRNDDRVRASHEAAALNGPYPLSDTEHRPPVYGDINCRCTPYPVRENPRGGTNFRP
jgi:hypothetical protein